MPAYGYLDAAILGLMTGIDGMADFIESIECMEALGIAYGAPIFAYVGDLGKGWAAHTDTAVITANGSFTGSDTAIIVTLNGVALTTVSYASASLATGNAVTAIIQAAIASIAGATAVFNDSAHTFTITTPGHDVTATLASNGVTATTAYSTVALFMGCAGFTQQSEVASAGGYKQYQAMNVAYQGFIYVQTSLLVQDGQWAYVIIAPGATQGQFTNVAGTDNVLTRSIFRTTTTGAAIANIELRGKQNAAGTL